MDDKAKIKGAKMAITLLPESHRSTMAYMVGQLNALMKRSESMRLLSANMASVLAPLFWKTKSVEISRHAYRQQKDLNSLLQTMIEIGESFSEIDPELVSELAALKQNQVKLEMFKSRVKEQLAEIKATPVPREPIRYTEVIVPSPGILQNSIHY